jgi:hypothetical protein
MKITPFCIKNVFIHTREIGILLFLIWKCSSRMKVNCEINSCMKM